MLEKMRYIVIDGSFRPKPRETYMPTVFVRNVTSHGTKPKQKIDYTILMAIYIHLSRPLRRRLPTSHVTSERWPVRDRLIAGNRDKPRSNSTEGGGVETWKCVLSITGLQVSACQLADQ